MRAFYHPGDSKGRLHAGECSRQSRHFQHTHKHTHTHISELCYERLNETKQLQRCKKHNTLDLQLSTNVQCQPSYLCLPFYYPLASQLVYFPLPLFPTSHPPPLCAVVTAEREQRCHVIVSYPVQRRLCDVIYTSRSPSPLAIAKMRR